MTASLKTNKTLTTRKIAYQCLLAVIKGSPSATSSKRILLDDMLSRRFEQENLSEQDRQFTTHLTYTTARYWFALDFCLKPLLKHPGKKLDKRLEVLLKLGLIQLSDKVSTPDYAAVNSMVELAKQEKLDKRLSGFLNALLKQASQSEITLSNHNVLPEWLVKRLKKTFTEKSQIQSIQTVFSTPPQWDGIRLNTLKTTPGEYLKQLDALGLQYISDKDSPEYLWIKKSQPGYHAVLQLPGYEDGVFLPQDYSAFLVGKLISPKAGEMILEVGAAPGGKTTHLAQLSHNRANIIAIENIEKRAQRLEDNLKNQDVTCTEVLCLDFLKWPEYAKESNRDELRFDKILIDAPCSASGIMRKHPDVLMQLSEQDFNWHAKLQTKLLEQAAKLVKPQGQIIYATCSIDYAENTRLIRQFLEKHPDFNLDSDRLMPIAEQEAEFAKENNQPVSNDGFYIAKLERS